MRLKQQHSLSLVMTLTVATLLLTGGSALSAPVIDERIGGHVSFLHFLTPYQSKRSTHHNRPDRALYDRGFSFASLAFRTCVHVMGARTNGVVEHYAEFLEGICAQKQSCSLPVHSHDYRRHISRSFLMLG